MEFYGVRLPDDTNDDLTPEALDALYTQTLKIIETFPPQMSQVFRIKHFDHYRYKQIADEMGISVNTVKDYLKKAKEKIVHLIPSP